MLANGWIKPDNEYIRHPDPDDLAWKRTSMPDYDAWAFGVHGCCHQRCCREGRQA